MDPYGNIGDVGGVAEKAVAAERAGATIFFVPKVEYAAAKSTAGSELHIYPVTTLDQVLHILERLGGSIPETTTNPVSAQAAP
jgi:PDZ domain-containing protein